MSCGDSFCECTGDGFLRSEHIQWTVDSGRWELRGDPRAGRRRVQGQSPRLELKAEEADWPWVPFDLLFTTTEGETAR